MVKCLWEIVQGIPNFDRGGAPLNTNFGDCVRLAILNYEALGLPASTFNPFGWIFRDSTGVIGTGRTLFLFDWFFTSAYWTGS